MAIIGTSRFRRFYICTVLVASAIAAGCTKDQAENTAQKPAQVQPKTIQSSDPTTGGTITTASIGEPSNLLWPLASDSASFEIISLVNDSLLEYDENLEIRGKLAKNYTITNGGLTIAFELHRGVHFHDGVTMTSADVVHSYKIITDPRTPTSYASNYDKVKYVRALDDYTVEVSYTEVFAPALSSWVSFSVIPKHLVPTAENIARNPLNRAPVGTGPYIFDSWKPGSEIILRANPDYFRGRPNIDVYRYRIIPDQQTMFLELVSEGIDQMALTPMQWNRNSQTAQFKENINKYQWNSFGYTYFGFNLARPPFNQKEIRHAIAYAINRKEIVDGVMQGLAKPSNGLYRSDLWYSNPNVRQYDYDAAKAKAILAEQGWSDSDGDGIIDKDGKPFSFELVTNQGNAQRQQCAEIIQQNLKAVGIDMRIRIIEWSAFLEKFVNTRAFDAIILGWSMGPEPDQYKFWHSSQTGPTQFNFVSYFNDEVDQLLELGRRTTDKDARKQIYFKLQDIVVEDAPYVWLYSPYALAAVNKRVQGIEVKPAGIEYNFESWWISPTR